MKLGLALALLLMLLVGATSPVLAMPGADWGRPVPLMRPGDEDGHTPRVVTDRQGRVHFFWVSALPNGSGNVIMYRRLDGDAWTEPRDILLTPEAGPLVIGWAAVDDRDYINLLWFDQGRTRDLFLSRAHTSLADSAQNWTTTALAVPSVAMGFSDLVVAPNGGMAVVYPLDHVSINVITSADYGVHWSVPVQVGGASNVADQAVDNPRIAVGLNGYLHVVWTLYAHDRNWDPVSVLYARSTDAGQTWTQRQVQTSTVNDPSVGWINVAVRGDSEVDLAWNRGAGTKAGRFHMWSSNNGDTWSNPKQFMPDGVSGETQWPLMVVDSAAMLHLVTVAQGGSVDGGPSRNNSGSGAPKYAAWNGTVWSPTYEFAEGSSDLDTALAIGLGNQLYLVHPTERGGGRLVYNRMTTGAPSIPPQTITAPQPPVRATPAIASALATPAGQSGSSPSRPIPVGDGVPTPIANDLTATLSISTVAVLGLLGIVLAINLMRIRR